jgi:acetyl esterase/lipase
MYLGGGDPVQPAASPGLRADVAAMPPTLLVLAEFDRLSDDALAYGERLAAAGREVAVHTYPMTHTVATPGVAQSVHRDTVAWLRQRLGRG